MARRNRDTRLVYSSESGRVPDAGQTGAGTTPRGDGVVRIARQTKGRKGKGVTVITGVPLSSDDLKDLAKSLKQKCGSGGTVKDGVIEIQGDHRDALVLDLQNRGWTVKKAGG